MSARNLLYLYPVAGIRSSAGGVVAGAARDDGGSAAGDGVRRSTRRADAGGDGVIYSDATGSTSGAPDRALEGSGTRGPQPDERRPAFRHRLEYAAFLAVYLGLASLPLRAAMWLAAAFAALAIRLDRRHRRIGLVNLAFAFPEKSVRERTAILVASWRNLGRMVAECAHLTRLTPSNVRKFISFDDELFWMGELSRQRAENGILVLSGHFGNWELFAYAHGILGHPVHLVRQTIKNPLIDAFVDRLRRRGGTQTLRKHNAARAVLRAMDERALMVLPLDQNATRRMGIFVDFFGREASTNSGFARIALRTGAPIYPAFLVREGTGPCHRIVILPRMQFASMPDRAQAVREITQACTAALEDMIRRYPDHWLWTHKRWRTRPIGEPGFYDA